MGSPLLQSHGWLSVIIKVFGHFPQRSRRGSWWHSCIPKHRGGNYNEAFIHFSDHKVCSWHQFKNSQAVVENDYLWPFLLQCTLIYLGNRWTAAKYLDFRGRNMALLTQRKEILLIFVIVQHNITYINEIEKLLFVSTSPCCCMRTRGINYQAYTNIRFSSSSKLCEKY